ncbi:probable UDP-sugar transporter protein SLC35A4 isoform X2 [Dendronephthya gigantea]|nr:probable UDP-sugar transporter protein SLC35A4 isoform X2 [Dendronephthya gigantea]
MVLPTPKQFIMFSVPGILYAVNNNLVVHIQAYMDPASFQVLSNLKIVTTVILYRIMLKRPISTNKWIAFTLITIAGASNSYGGWLSNQSLPEHHSLMEIHVTFNGIFLILLFCCISGTAGVYTEYILKKQAKLPFAVQSIMLYIFGVGMNFFAFFVSQLLRASSNENLGFKETGDVFEGFSKWTLIIIVSQALSGIINGVIMKQASSLTRLILIAGAMLISTTLSVFLFGLQFNDYFITAFILVIIAMFIYHRPDR